MDGDGGDFFLLYFFSRGEGEGEKDVMMLKSVAGG